MLHGHGDDLYQYPDIRINFSSNVYNHFNQDKLFAYLTERLQMISNYPEPAPLRLEKELAGALSLAPAEVLVSNGATEAIYLLAQTWQRAESSILVPTFSEYADACRMHNHEVRYIHSLGEISSDKATRLDSQSFTSLVWLCNPNNPTGEVLDKELLLGTFHDNPDTLFVVDASYAVFTRKSLLSAAEAASLPNVLMLHSMTKEFAIPGLRLGFVTGCDKLLGLVRENRMPWSVNALAQDAGSYLIRHRQDYVLPLELLLSERDRVATALNSLGIETWPSDTHILLCRLPRGKAADLKDWLALSHGILIRDASNFEGLTDACFRIAVQTPVENDALLSAIMSQVRL